MAADNLYSLLIRVEGGDAAAAEIIKTQYALKKVEGGHTAIKEKFQEGFQHIALKGFLGEQARAIGLGGEMQKVLGLVSHGMTELGGAAGLAGSSVALMGTGLMALAAVALVAYNHFKKHNENLDELARKQTEARETTLSLGDAFEKYAKEVGKLPPYLVKVKEAQEDLNRIQTEALRITEQKNLAAMRDEIAANEDRIGGIRAYITELERQTANQTASERAHADLLPQIEYSKGAVRDLELANKELAAKLEIATGNIVAQGRGAKDAADDLAKMTAAQRELAEEEGRLSKLRLQDEKEWDDAVTKRMAKEQAGIDEIAADRSNLAHLTKQLASDEAEAAGSAQQKKQAQIQRYYDQQKKAIDDLYNHAKRAAATSGQSIEMIEKQRANALTQLNRTVAEKMRQNYNSIQLAAASLGRSVTASFASSAARAITSGKSMHDSYIAITNQIKEQIIADTIAWGVHEGFQVAKSIAGFGTKAGAAASGAKAEIAANALVIASNEAKVASVAQLTVALGTATKAAIALDLALAAAV